MAQDNIHSIRLHGPWQATVLESFDLSVDLDQASRQQRLKHPCDWGQWLSNAFRGRLSLRRPFRMPTGLDADQAVFLVIEPNHFSATVTLNDQPVGLVGNETGIRIDVSKQLETQNYLVVEIEIPTLENESSDETLQSTCGFSGCVRLEITE